MMRSLKELKQEVPDFQFKYEAMLAFWLAIDLEKSQEAVELYKMEPLIQTAVKNLKKNGTFLLVRRIERFKEKNNKKKAASKPAGAAASDNEKNKDESSKNDLSDPEEFRRN